MKKAILCFPFVTSRQPQYPTGVYKVASFCEDFYDVTVLDQRIDTDIIHMISELISKNDDILCLGLSVMTGEQIKHAIDISKKFHRKLQIVWGGLHPTILPEQTLNNEFIDYIVIGEGEEAFLNLLQYLSGKDIPREMFLSKKNNNYGYNYIADLNTSGYIDFSRFRIREEYFVKRDGFRRAFTLETSRGCPYNCYYCHNTIHKKPYRTLLASKVIDVIEKLKNYYNIDGIVFQEDNFFADMKRAEEIIEKLVCINSIGWKTNSRINYFYKKIDDKKFMEKLLLSGCSVLQFGIESGSPKVLRMINKGIDIKKVILVNKKLSSYPIRIRYNFIVGFPGETKNDINNTFQLIDRLLKDNPYAESPFVNIYNPYPGTQLYKEALKCGFKEPGSLSGWSEFNWNKMCFDYLSGDIADLIEKKSVDYFRDSKYLRPG